MEEVNCICGRCKYQYKGIIGKINKCPKCKSDFRTELPIGFKQITFKKITSVFEKNEKFRK